MLATEKEEAADTDDNQHGDDECRDERDEPLLRLVRSTADEVVGDEPLRLQHDVVLEPAAAAGVILEEDLLHVLHARHLLARHEERHDHLVRFERLARLLLRRTATDRVRATVQDRSYVRDDN